MEKNLVFCIIGLDCHSQNVVEPLHQPFGWRFDVLPEIGRFMGTVGEDGVVTRSVLLTSIRRNPPPEQRLLETGFFLFFFIMLTGPWVSLLLPRRLSLPSTCCGAVLHVHYHLSKVID